MLEQNAMRFPSGAHAGVVFSPRNIGKGMRRKVSSEKM